MMLVPFINTREKVWHLLYTRTREIYIFFICKVIMEETSRIDRNKVLQTYNFVSIKDFYCRLEYFFINTFQKTLLTIKVN